MMERSTQRRREQQGQKRRKAPLQALAQVPAPPAPSVQQQKRPRGCPKPQAPVQAPVQAQERRVERLQQQRRRVRRLVPTLVLALAPAPAPAQHRKRPRGWLQPLRLALLQAQQRPPERPT